MSRTFSYCTYERQSKRHNHDSVIAIVDDERTLRVVRQWCTVALSGAGDWSQAAKLNTIRVNMLTESALLVKLLMYRDARQLGA